MNKQVKFMLWGIGKYASAIGAYVFCAMMAEQGVTRQRVFAVCLLTVAAAVGHKMCARNDF